MTPSLRNEVKKTLQFLIDMDIQLFGKITTGTQDAISTQGYILKKGKLIKA